VSEIPLYPSRRPPRGPAVRGNQRCFDLVELEEYLAHKKTPPLGPHSSPMPRALQSS